MRRYRHLLALAGTISALSAGPAFAEALAVNPGLWETTVDMGAVMSQSIPPDALAKMTPERRAMVEKMIASARGPKTHKKCLTQAMLDKGMAEAMQNSKRCTVTTITAAPRHAEYRIECTGNNAMHGIARIEAPDAQTITSTMDGSVTDKDGQSHPIHFTSDNHWLAADCGDVKPKE
jgi:hypothetical protein